MSLYEHLLPKPHSINYHLWLFLVWLLSVSDWDFLDVDNLDVILLKLEEFAPGGSGFSQLQRLLTAAPQRIVPLLLMPASPPLAE